MSRTNKSAATGIRPCHSGRNGFPHLDVLFGTAVARAVVWKLTCAVPVPDAMLTEEGDTVQVELVGAPLQVSATVWLKPPELARFSVKLAV